MKFHSYPLIVRILLLFQKFTQFVGLTAF